MARHIQSDGTETEVHPKNGKKFSLDELQAYVKGFVEVINLDRGKMLVNEDARMHSLPVNEKASTIFGMSTGHVRTPILGDVLILDLNEKL